MNILITGATGLIGKAITKKLIDDGHAITILSRTKTTPTAILNNSLKTIEWNLHHTDPTAIARLSEKLSGTECIINLAGENISGKRWNKNFKKRIIESRVNSTKFLVEVIKQMESKPKLFIGASAIGYYGIESKNEITEESKPGDDFMAKVCIEWERASEELLEMNINRAIVRIGIVLSTEGGALKKMLLPYKLFVGGPLGSGKQWFPWIHIDDLTNIFMFILQNNLSGVFNGVAPSNITMRQFSKTLGKTLHRPSFFFVPEFVLRIVLGEFAKYLVTGLKIKPKKLIESKFVFNFLSIESTLKDLLDKT